MSIWIGAKDIVDSFMKPGCRLGYGDRLSVVKLDYMQGVVMTKVYKIELMIVDYDGLGIEEILTVLKETNDCIAPMVLSIDTADVDAAEIDYPDTYILNDPDTTEEFIRRLQPLPDILLRMRGLSQ